MAKEQVKERKQIELDVKYRIGRGEPKQQIFEDLSPLYKDKVALVRSIELTPSKKTRAKYGIYNYMLAALLASALAMDAVMLLRLDLKYWNSFDVGHMLVNYNFLFSIVLDAVFLAGVLLYRINIYSWIATRALITLVTIIVSYGYFNTVLDPLIFISLGLVMISFVFGLMLSVKLCPPRIPKIIEVDIDGVEKIKKTIYVYPD